MSWISVEDKLPPEGDRYLVLIEHESFGHKFMTVDTARYCCYQKWVLKDSLREGLSCPKVISWLHLPPTTMETK